MPDKTGARQDVCEFALHIYAQYSMKFSFSMLLPYTFYHCLPVCSPLNFPQKGENKKT